MGVAPQVLKIVFEVQRKMNNEKITRREINFLIYKILLFFPLFGPLLLSNLITFLFLIHFKGFKMLQVCHLKFYKSFLNLITTQQHTRNFVGVWEPIFEAFGEFLTPSTLRGHNILNSISFLMIFSAPNVPIRRVQVLFRHQKQWNHPLGSGLP